MPTHLGRRQAPAGLSPCRQAGGGVPGTRLAIAVNDRWGFSLLSGFGDVAHFNLRFSPGMWHIGYIVKKKSAATAAKSALRYSFPPYYVGVMDGKLPVFNVPGECWKDLERGLAPAAGEARQTLLRLRSELRWPRSALAAFVGVSRDVVRRWETGERNPSGAARRLIWLLDLLVHHPEKLKSGMDLIFWGKGAECLEFHKNLCKSAAKSKADTAGASVTA